MSLLTSAQVGDVYVDVAAIRNLAHRCEPLNCSNRRSCCATYEVPIDPDQVGTIVGTVREAARFAPHLLEQGVPVDLFDDTEGGLCLNTDENGACLFAYHDDRGAPLCSLHAAALDAGLPPARVKPRACALWPLALSEGSPPVLGVQPGAFDFACNRPRTEGESNLDPGVAAIIRAALGERFLTELLGVLAAE